MAGFDDVRSYLEQVRRDTRECQLKTIAVSEDPVVETAKAPADPQVNKDLLELFILQKHKYMLHQTLRYPSISTMKAVARFKQLADGAALGNELDEAVGEEVWELLYAIDPLDAMTPDASSDITMLMRILNKPLATALAHALTSGQLILTGQKS